MKRNGFLLLVFWVLSSFFFFPSLCLAAQRVEEQDRDGDGRKETKVYFENERVVKMVIDQNRDKKPDLTVYFKNDRPDVGEQDANYDGRIETWIKYDAAGTAIIIGKDRHVDGKPDYWIYLKKGEIYMREWDRNFDGKPDFRTLEKAHKLLEKQYDDNFDGKFEKIVKAPARGERGHILA